MEATEAVAEETASGAASGLARSRLRVAVGFAVPGLILLVPVLLISASFWPGHMNADSLVELGEVQRGSVTNQHAPLLLMLWIPVYRLGFGPGSVLTGQILVFITGCYLTLRAALGRVPAAVAAAAVALFPPLFGTLGLVGTDVWFTAPLVLCVGLTVRAAQSTGRRRGLCLAGGVVAAWVALAARQNAAFGVVLPLTGIIALIVATGRLGWLRAHGGRWSSLRVACAGVLLTVLLVASQAAIAAAAHVFDARQQQYIYIYDIGAISYHDRRDRFPGDVLPRAEAPLAVSMFNPDSVQTYVAPGRPTATYLRPARGNSLARAWRRLVLSEPLAYLHARWNLFWRQVALTRPPRQLYHPQIDPNGYELRIRFRWLNARAKAYVESFGDAEYQGDFLFRAWIYLVLGLVASWFLLRRSRPWPQRIVGLLGASAVVFQVGLAALATGVNYRYEFPAVAMDVLVVITAVAVWFSERRSRSVVSAAAAA